jgi:hypothetical protein
MLQFVIFLAKKNFEICISYTLDYFSLVVKNADFTQQ